MSREPFPATALCGSWSLLQPVWHVQLDVRCQTVWFAGGREASSLNIGEKPPCTVGGHGDRVMEAGPLLGTSRAWQFAPRVMGVEAGSSPHSAPEWLITSEPLPPPSPHGDSTCQTCELNKPVTCLVRAIRKSFLRPASTPPEGFLRLILGVCSLNIGHTF